MKKFFHKVANFIDMGVLKLILILTYFTLPCLLIYTLYNFYLFNIPKILVGLLITMCFAKLNKGIQGGRR